MHALAQRSGFRLAEIGLAAHFEDFGDGQTFAALNLVVQIEETPSQLPGESAANGGLSASHEAHQINAGGPLELEYHGYASAYGVKEAARESNNSIMQEGWLPLFPLQVVLFPGGPLPLHIFEERYKEMMQEIIRDREEFGVLMASEKGIVNIGCTATVDSVLRRYPDGRLDLLTRGRRRFEIQRLNDERTFLRGQVEFFDDDPDGGAESGLRNSAIEVYNELQKLASNDPLEPAYVADPQLSFRLAQVVNDLAFRQVLLVSRSEADRIKRLAEFFPGHLIRERHALHVKQVAPRNGHGKMPDGTA